MGDVRKTVDKLETAEKLAEWHVLLSKGWTQQMIADEYGVSQPNVSKQIKRYRENIYVPGMVEYVQDQYERLMELRRALQVGIDEGHTRSIEVAIQLEARIAKLVGSDKPDKVEVEITDATPEHIKALLAKRKQLESEEIIEAEVVDD